MYENLPRSPQKRIKRRDPTRSGPAVQAFAREKELCKLLKDAETAHRCLRNHKPIPASSSDRTHHSFAILLPLVAQQAVLLEQAATAGVGGAGKRERAAEEAADFRLFADDTSSVYASLCVTFGAVTNLK